MTMRIPGVGLILSCFALSLAGCNGNLALKEISPRRIVLVDALPSELTSATLRCMTLEGMHVEKIAGEWRGHSRIAAAVGERLEAAGYGVAVIAPPDAFGPDFHKYMLSPTKIYESDWDSTFKDWVRKLGADHEAGAVVFLRSYSDSVAGLQGPFYDGFGVAGTIGCLGIPPTKLFLHANVGIDVFTIPDVTRKYFTRSLPRVCDVPAPADFVDRVQHASLSRADMDPLLSRIEAIGTIQAETALSAAGLLKAPVDRCP